MSQKLAGADVVEVGATQGFENVGENWNYYDTVLVGGYVPSMQFHDGWFTTFAAIGAAVQIPFFNVRNRNHGLAYNNQDTRDQTAFAYRIFTIGVSFFAPSCGLYQSAVPGPVGPETTQTQLWELELPKHASLTLQVQQDERLAGPVLMTPPGYGPVGGGVSQGDPELSWVPGGAPPNTALWNFTQGVPELTNKWGFRNPIEVPRRANLAVVIQFSEYGRQLLADLSGPHSYPFQSVLAGNWIYKYGMFGIQVVLGGQRLVQQRGQYHA